MPKHFHFLLGILALLAGAAHGSSPPDTPACITQAWVRAPDLAPNAIVHGDARVKISAECPDFDGVLLGLRFKERSFAKALRSREDTKHPESPVSDDFSDMSPWAAVPSLFTNRSAQDAHEQVLADWIVQEEERVVFETTYPVNMWNRSHGILRDAIQNFTIFVPSTNFPPALDNFNTLISYAGDSEVVDAEWMYEYFAQVFFVDGTTRDISAGLTAFQPFHDPAHTSDEPASVLMMLQNVFGSLASYPSTTNYSVELSSISGLTFFAGIKSQHVTAIITRTGPPRSFPAPLNISACVMPKMTFEWAAKYGVLDADLNTAFAQVSLLKLRATSDGSKQPFRTWDSCHKVSFIMPSLTADEYQDNTTVTTISAPVTLFVDVDEDHVPTFKGYYQTLANSLVVTLEIPRTENELIDPDDPLSEPEFQGWVPMFEDDEEAWVPWEKKTHVWHGNSWKSYTGRVPVVVHPSGYASEGTLPWDFLNVRADTSEQVILTNGGDRKQPPLIHYLVQDARGPIFVDIAIPDLLAKDPEERQLRAPILEPVVYSPSERKEAARRYYHRFDFKRPLIYVGETWAKRVAHKDEVSGVVAGSVSARVRSAVYDTFIPAGSMFSWFQSFSAIL